MLGGIIMGGLFFFPISYIGSYAPGAFIMCLLSFVEAVVIGFGGTHNEDVG